MQHKPGPSNAETQKANFKQLLKDFEKITSDGSNLKYRLEDKITLLQDISDNFLNAIATNEDKALVDRFFADKTVNEIIHSTLVAVQSLTNDDPTKLNALKTIEAIQKSISRIGSSLSSDNLALLDKSEVLQNAAKTHEQAAQTGPTTASTASEYLDGNAAVVETNKGWKEASSKTPDAVAQTGTTASTASEYLDGNAAVVEPTKGWKNAAAQQQESTQKKAQQAIEDSNTTKKLDYLTTLNNMLTIFARESSKTQSLPYILDIFKNLRIHIESLNNIDLETRQNVNNQLQQFFKNNAVIGNILHSAIIAASKKSSAAPQLISELAYFAKRGNLVFDAKTTELAIAVANKEDLTASNNNFLIHHYLASHDTLDPKLTKNFVRHAIEWADDDLLKKILTKNIGLHFDKNHENVDLITLEDAQIEVAKVLDFLHSFHTALQTTQLTNAAFIDALKKYGEDPKSPLYFFINKIITDLEKSFADKKDLPASIALIEKVWAQVGQHKVDLHKMHGTLTHPIHNINNQIIFDDVAIPVEQLKNIQQIGDGNFGLAYRARYDYDKKKGPDPKFTQFCLLLRDDNGQPIKGKDGKLQYWFFLKEPKRSDHGDFTDEQLIKFEQEAIAADSLSSKWQSENKDNTKQPPFNLQRGALITSKLKGENTQSRLIIGKLAAYNVAYAADGTPFPESSDAKKFLMEVKDIQDQKATTPNKRDKALIEFYNNDFDVIMANVIGIHKATAQMASYGWLHLDIATRNMLVDNTVFKDGFPIGISFVAADFGFALPRGSDGLVQENGTQVPIKWSSPERLRRSAIGPEADAFAARIVMLETIAYDTGIFLDDLIHPSTDNEAVFNNLLFTNPGQIASYVGQSDTDTILQQYMDKIHYLLKHPEFIPAGPNKEASIQRLQLFADSFGYYFTHPQTNINADSELFRKAQINYFITALNQKLAQLTDANDPAQLQKFLISVNRQIENLKNLDIDEKDFDAAQKQIYTLAKKLSAHSLVKEKIIANQATILPEITALQNTLPAITKVLYKSILEENIASYKAQYQKNLALANSLADKEPTYSQLAFYHKNSSQQGIASLQGLIDFHSKAGTIDAETLKTLNSELTQLQAQLATVQPIWDKIKEQTEAAKKVEARVIEELSASYLELKFIATHHPANLDIASYGRALFLLNQLRSRAPDFPNIPLHEDIQSALSNEDRTIWENLAKQNKFKPLWDAFNNAQPNAGAFIELASQMNKVNESLHSLSDIKTEIQNAQKILSKKNLKPTELDKLATEIESEINILTQNLLDLTNLEDAQTACQKLVPKLTKPEQWVGMIEMNGGSLSNGAKSNAKLLLNLAPQIEAVKDTITLLVNKRTSLAATRRKRSYAFLETKSRENSLRETLNSALKDETILQTDVKEILDHFTDEDGKLKKSISIKLTDVEILLLENYLAPYREIAKHPFTNAANVEQLKIHYNNESYMHALVMIANNHRDFDAFCRKKHLALPNVKPAQHLVESVQKNLDNTSNNSDKRNIKSFLEIKNLVRKYDKKISHMKGYLSFKRQDQTKTLNLEGGYKQVRKQQNIALHNALEKLNNKLKEVSFDTGFNKCEKLREQLYELMRYGLQQPADEMGILRAKYVEGILTQLQTTRTGLGIQNYLANKIADKNDPIHKHRHAIFENQPTTIVKSLQALLTTVTAPKAQVEKVNKPVETVTASREKEPEKNLRDTVTPVVSSFTKTLDAITPKVKNAEEQVKGSEAKVESAEELVESFLSLLQETVTLLEKVEEIRKRPFNQLKDKNLFTPSGKEEETVEAKNNPNPKLSQPK